MMNNQRHSTTVKCRSMPEKSTFSKDTAGWLKELVRFSGNLLWRITDFTWPPGSAVMDSQYF